MILTNKNLYQSINKIIFLLNEAGKSSYAKQLEDTLSISTVPSEFLGETRIVLERLTYSYFMENLEIKQEVSASLSYINSIL